MAERQTNPNVQAVSNKTVQDYLTSNFGEESVKIIRAATEDMTDDALAVKCKLKVSEIRMVLNKMHSMRLAEYTRIKDKDTGWYSYIWRVNLGGIYEVLNQSMQGEINQLNNQLEENTTVLSYICSKCSKSNVIDFEIASKLAFRCPNCKRRLYEKKNSNDEIVSRLGELKTKHTAFQGHIRKHEEMKRLEAQKRLEEMKAAKEAAMKRAAEEAEAAKLAKIAKRKAAVQARAVARKALKAKLMRAKAPKMKARAKTAKKRR
ncbi:Transcription factor E [uncultured archaeon]|nr:Transcription factor E [uncultured archaeon]